jgi:hypothetical protein
MTSAEFPSTKNVIDKSAWNWTRQEWTNFAH